MSPPTGTAGVAAPTQQDAGSRKPGVFARLTGPYAPLVVMFLGGLLLLSGARLGMALWQWPRVSGSGLGWELMLHGIRVDLIQLSLLALIPVLLAPLLANPLGWRIWQPLVRSWALGGLTLLIFLEIITPGFIAEYDTRPNRIFVEYLLYPREVGTMLWRGFRLELLLTLGVTGLGGILAARMLRQAGVQPARWRTWVLWLSWPILVLALVLGIRSTLDHRPVNPAYFALSSDTLVNSLMLNSAWSVAHAVYDLGKENISSEIYGEMDTAVMLATVREARLANGARPALVESNELPTLSRLVPARPRARPLNLVIVLEESLGASFVESLGGVPVTPELERLKHTGWWFERLYATGTRSVRGIEAVVSGFPPTPAQSVVKLAKAQGGFATLGEILGREGYHTSFVYGGESHFDNMRGFFMSNGFQSVIDQNDYASPTFKGSWGVSDEDLFERAHRQIMALHDEGRPFFTLVFTSSNHSPFEYPAGRIQGFDAQPATENNAAKYADYALGRFMDQAMASTYWADTLFLIVADHDIRVRGAQLVPVEAFHIPALILGADIQARRVRSVASQIDLPVTLLSLMGIETTHPMIGRDLAVEPEALPGRAMLQYGNLYAWMEGEDLVVLRPDKPPAFARFDPIAGSLTESPPPAQGEALAARALAHAQLGSWLYRTGRYRLPEP